MVKTVFHGYNLKDFYSGFLPIIWEPNDALSRTPDIRFGKHFVFANIASDDILK